MTGKMAEAMVGIILFFVALGMIWSWWPVLIVGFFLFWSNI